jgi:hypothetical protein
MRRQSKFKDRLIEGATYAFQDLEFIACFRACCQNPKCPATGRDLTTVLSEEGPNLRLVLETNGRLPWVPPERKGPRLPHAGWIGDLRLVRVAPRRAVFGLLVDGRLGAI